MHRRGSAGGPGPAGRARLDRAVLVPAVIVLAAGCAAGHPGGAGPAAASPAARLTTCGTTRTAANVPVRIEIARGPVTCSTAMSIERGYGAAVAAGKAPGNGGGGPVTVRGWTCQGFATPVVLKTGKASRCVQGSSEILAVLPVQA